MPQFNDEPVKAHLLTSIAIELALKNNEELTNLRGLISAPGVSGANASMACQAFDDKEWTPDVGLLSDRRAGMFMPAHRAARPVTLSAAKCQLGHCHSVARIRIAVSEISEVMSEPHVVAWP